jgi:predicted kinase
MCSFRVLQLLDIVEDPVGNRSAPASDAEVGVYGEECASSNPPSQDEEGDPDKVFSQILTVLAEI